MFLPVLKYSLYFPFFTDLCTSSEKARCIHVVFTHNFKMLFWAKKGAITCMKSQNVLLVYLKS